MITIKLMDMNQTISYILTNNQDGMNKFANDLDF